MADDANSRPSSGGPVTSSSTTTTTTTTHGPFTTSTTYTTAGPRTTVSTSTPNSTTSIAHPTVTTTHRLALPRAPSASIATQTDNRPTIRIRRQGNEAGTQTARDVSEQVAGRRRSSSDPQPAHLHVQTPGNDDLEIRRLVTATPLQTLHEEGSGVETPRLDPVPVVVAPPAVPLRSSRRPGWARQLSTASLRGRGSDESDAPQYEAQVVNMLDVIDPEVSTLTTLNNVQNSLFIPNLGAFYRRQPTYDLSQSSPVTSDEELGIERASLDEAPQQEDETTEGQARARRPTELNRLATTNTISSVLTGMSEGHNYAVLPHGASLPGWTAEEKAALNNHVRHLLHSRRARFKRSMRGFGRYVRKPVGFLVSLYAFLLTFWGAAWVLFLIGWISVEGRQAYFIEICDQILTALFCVVGIGFAPWRAVDTYHMIFVAHYAHLTWRLRKERGLPALKDRNELPSRPQSHAWEKGQEPELEPDAEMSVLTAVQQQKLEHHQSKLSESHTFYKPHETTTHSAFSLRLLITIIVLLDCHSLFQMALGGTTWGIYYKHRPKALTAVILTCSISCNISAGIIISVGDRKSRKRMVIEQMFRQGLTEEAIETLGKERGLKAKGVGNNK